MSYLTENSQFVTNEYWDRRLQISNTDRATFVGQTGVDANGWYYMYWSKNGKVYHTCQNICPFPELVDFSTYPVPDKTFREFLIMELEETIAGTQVSGPAPTEPNNGEQRP
jgi:hypothetical protein